MLYTARVNPVGNLKYSVCSLRLEFYLQYFWHNSINMEYLNALHTDCTTYLEDLIYEIKNENIGFQKAKATIKVFNSIYFKS